MSLASLCHNLSNENLVEELYKLALENKVWFNKRKVLAVRCYSNNNTTEFIIYMPHRTVRIISHHDRVVVAVK